MAKTPTPIDKVISFIKVNKMSHKNIDLLIEARK